MVEVCRLALPVSRTGGRLRQVPMRPSPRLSIKTWGRRDGGGRGDWREAGAGGIGSMAVGGGHRGGGGGRNKFLISGGIFFFGGDPP